MDLHSAVHLGRDAERRDRTSGVSSAGQLWLATRVLDGDALGMVMPHLNTAEAEIDRDTAIVPSLGALGGVAIEQQPICVHHRIVRLALTAAPTLVFDGGWGHYQEASEPISGDVRYSNPNGPTTYTNTWLILTLDVPSNQSNYRTEVGFDFYNQTERLGSTSAEFVCWEPVAAPDLASSREKFFGNHDAGLFDTNRFNPGKIAEVDLRHQSTGCAIS